MLERYQQKRDFKSTPEPEGAPEPQAGPLLFTVQKHAARRLHYDFRLELDGVLKSWSVPAGPSVDPGVKRLAVMVEDHPLDYRNFEGVIPRGEYGAGQVIVWDEGTYTPEAHDKSPVGDREKGQELMRQGLGEGKVSFILHGHKLRGSWTLVKMRRAHDDWLLIKHTDDYAKEAANVLMRDESVLSGLTINDLKAGHVAHGDAGRVLSPAQIKGARGADFPSTVRPMLAFTAARPPSDAGWLFEPKLDGFRTLAQLRDGETTLISRNGINVTQKYPQVAAGLKAQPMKSAVFDGEIVAFDARGRPCFQCLQQYLRAGQTVEVPALTYYVFDILYLDGYELLGVPLSQRKELLDHLLDESAAVRRTAYFERDAPLVYEAALSQGMEGIMAKQASSLYMPGRRSENWLKIKRMLSDDFVVGGFTQGLGNRAGTFGALLLGYYEDGGNLVYAGNVGSGFDGSTLTAISGLLDGLRIDHSPFNSATPPTGTVTWVQPKTVVEVKYSEWTQDGRLRTPVFLRLREDKAADEVRPSRIAVSYGDRLEAEPADSSQAVDLLAEQLDNPSDRFTIESEGHKLALTNLGKVLWPEHPGGQAVTKRDLLRYLLLMSPYLLRHAEDRPLTLKRYPEGIYGEYFYQRHWDENRPDFVEAVSLNLGEEGVREFLLCNNVTTLLWLGQIGSIEFHTWFSRLSLAPEGEVGEVPGRAPGDITEYPDFIIFDVDPYVYSGKEAAGAEPELNRTGFSMVSRVALWLKETLDSLSLSAFVKTSGRTGLHIYVPINRRLKYRAVRSAAETIARFVVQRHPGEVTMEWTVGKRRGKVFIDYNQNVRSKTLGAAYAPRVAPEATISTPLRWDELGKVYPTDFTILTVPKRVSETGDPWANILQAKRDVNSLLEI